VVLDPDVGAWRLSRRRGAVHPRHHRLDRARVARARRVARCEAHRHSRVIRTAACRSVGTPVEGPVDRLSSSRRPIAARVARDESDRRELGHHHHSRDHLKRRPRAVSLEPSIRGWFVQPHCAGHTRSDIPRPWRSLRVFTSSSDPTCARQTVTPLHPAAGHCCPSGHRSGSASRLAAASIEPRYR
jgi:hypothetical protein